MLKCAFLNHSTQPITFLAKNLAKIGRRHIHCTVGTTAMGKGRGLTLAVQPHHVEVASARLHANVLMNLDHAHKIFAHG